MCLFDHFPISAKFDQDICVMGKKILTVKYLYCTFKFTVPKIDHMGKDGENLRVCKKNPPSELNWSWRFLSFFRILLEFFLDFAWVLSFSELEFFSQCPKKSPGIHKYPEVSLKWIKSLQAIIVGNVRMYWGYFYQNFHELLKFIFPWIHLITCTRL